MVIINTQCPITHIRSLGTQQSYPITRTQINKYTAIVASLQMEDIVGKRFSSQRSNCTGTDHFVPVLLVLVMYHCYYLVNSNIIQLMVQVKPAQL